jgi:branched-subunit amino acid transport protein AzlD
MSEAEPFAYRRRDTVANWLVIVAFVVSCGSAFVTTFPIMPFTSDDPADLATAYALALALALVPAVILFVRALGSRRRLRRRRPVGLVVAVLVIVGSLFTSGRLLLGSVAEMVAR